MTPEQHEAVAWHNPDLEHDAEEYECAMKVLDGMGVPRADEKGEVFSLVGRIKAVAPPSQPEGVREALSKVIDSFGGKLHSEKIDAVLAVVSPIPSPGLVEAAQRIAELEARIESLLIDNGEVALMHIKAEQALGSERQRREEAEAALVQARADIDNISFDHNINVDYAFERIAIYFRKYEPGK